jgi:lipopolysaccharide biosynthesis regulator YciM
MKTRMPRLLCSLVALAASGLLTLSTTAGAADEMVELEKLSDEQLTVVSETGTDIVARIDKARDLIKRDDWTGARFEVGKARAELGRVRDVSPSARIHDRIEAALKALRSPNGAQAAQQQLLPIYQELDAQKDVVAVADARTWVDKAKNSLAAGQEEEAEDALVSASANIDYFAIDLPVQATYSRLTSALIALRAKNVAQANADLGEAQKNIQVVVAAASSSMVADDDEEMPAVSAE